MLVEVLFYLGGIAAMVGGVLALERVVAGPHSTSGTGYARVDSAIDFERMRSRQSGSRVAALLRHGSRAALPVLPAAGREHRVRRDAGEQLIPLKCIVGSVDGAAEPFDRNFRPVSDRARARLSSILVAMRREEALPPIDVWSWGGAYYVLDGHHRVAAARALGSDSISAHVIEVD